MSEQEKKPIDEVTVELLNSALRIHGCTIGANVLDLIIDLVELIEEKGDKTTLREILDVQKPKSF